MPPLAAVPEAQSLQAIPLPAHQSRSANGHSLTPLEPQSTPGTLQECRVCLPGKPVLHPSQAFTTLGPSPKIRKKKKRSMYVLGKNCSSSFWSIQVDNPRLRSKVESHLHSTFIFKSCCTYIRYKIYMTHRQEAEPSNHRSLTRSRDC